MPSALPKIRICLLAISASAPEGEGVVAEVGVGEVEAALGRFEKVPPALKPVVLVAAAAGKDGRAAPLWLQSTCQRLKRAKLSWKVRLRAWLECNYYATRLMR